MTFHPVYVLPLIAFAMVLFLPLFRKETARSKSLKSRRRRKILLGRILVFILLLATIVTFVLPVEEINSLVQGVVITLILWLPLVFLHWIYTFRLKRSKRGESDEEDEDEDSGQPNNEMTVASDQKSDTLGSRDIEALKKPLGTVVVKDSVLTEEGDSNQATSTKEREADVIESSTKTSVNSLSASNAATVMGIEKTEEPRFVATGKLDAAKKTPGPSGDC